MGKVKINKDDLNNIHLRKDDFNELIGIIPKSYLHYGIPIIFLFVLIILIGSWFFNYPDIVNAKVEITVNNLPVTIISHSSGRIEKLFVNDNELVEKDKILAVIENTAEFSDVMSMKNFLNPFQEYFQNDDSIFLMTPNKSFKLGDIQSFYSSFLKRYDDYHNFIKLSYHKKKIAIINIEIQQQEQYLGKLRNKLNNSKEQLKLARNIFYRDSLLFMKEVISLADFEKSRSQYLQEKNNCESANNEILSTVMQITRLNQTILDLESQKLEQTTQQRNELKENYEILLARLLDWEKAYLLKAPVNGQITFTHFWKNNQNIKVGDAVYTIIPTGSKSFIGKIQVPIQSSGKVRVGQNVIIKLDDFPYMEFGLLQGKITKISLVPDNDFYSAEIIFPSTLITTYGKNISLKNVLKGNCEIIIRNQPLILKFLYPLKALIDRGKLK